MSVTRLADWLSRLVSAAMALEGVPFQYGRHDCCVTGCRLLEAVTGVNFATEFGTYTRKRKAEVIIAKHGGFEAMIRGVAEKHGIPEVPPLFARRGDAVLVPTNLGLCLGVVDPTGKMVYVPNGKGLKTVPLSLATAAWRVG